MRYLSRIVALMLIILAGLAPTSALARQGDPIRVTASAVEPAFPNEIVFSLSATSDTADITQVQLLYGASRSGALTVVELPVPAGRSVSLKHRLDTQVYYYPPGADMTYRWLIRDAAGNTIESDPQPFVYHDERFSWSERRLGQVTIYWHQGGDSFGDELEGAAQRALDNLQAELGAGLSQPVRIYIYASLPEMYTALQANSAEWIGGQANLSLGVILGAIAPEGIREARRLIPHELSHQVLHQATENPYGGIPLWFNEGLAVHNQEVRDLDYDQLVQQAAGERRLIPLEALASSFPADPEQARLSYAQSRDIVEYILDTYGEAKLRDLAQAFGEATPVDQAVQQALDRTVDELDAEWRQGLPRPAGPAPDLAGPQTAPDSRFDDPPVLPDGAQPPPGQAGAVNQPPDQPRSGFADWLAGLPAWATLGAVAVLCLVGVVIVGVALLVALRLIGVDKRTN